MLPHWLAKYIVWWGKSNNKEGEKEITGNAAAVREVGIKQYEGYKSGMYRVGDEK